MTQPAWNAPENAYNEQPQQRADYGKKSPQQAPTLGGWINSVMPERVEQQANSGQYQPMGYGVPMQNMPTGSAMPMQNGMPMQQQGMDIHGIYQRLDDLAGTISRMERAPARPVYSGNNRRSEEYQSYAGAPRRVEDFQPYSAAYRGGAVQPQGQEMISQLIMRVEDAERQAREAWRAAHNVMSVAQKSSSKGEAQGSESAIARAERILAAADETARKTLALLASKQGDASAASAIAAEAQQVSLQANAAQEQASSENAQLSAQLKAIEARLEALAEAKTAAQNQLAESHKNNDVSDHLKTIEARLESLLEEKLEAHAKQPLQEKLEQLALIEPRLASLMEEKLNAHKQPASPDNSAQLSSIESRLEALLNEKLAIHDKLPLQEQMEQIASIESRIESLLEEKLAAHKQVMPDNSAQLASIESRLEAFIANTSQEEVSQSNSHVASEEKLSALFERLEFVGQKLESLSGDLENLKSQTATVANALDEERICAIIDETIARSDMNDNQNEDSNVEYIEGVQSQISQLFNEFENGRTEDARVLDHLYQEITSIRLQDAEEGKTLEKLSEQIDGLRKMDEMNLDVMGRLFNELDALKTNDTNDAQVLEKLYGELHSIRQQDALVYNEIEDISARLEDQILSLKEQISQPAAPQPPIMEALEDIYSKLDLMGEKVDKDTHDSMYEVMNAYMEKIQLATDRSEEEILEQLRMTYEQIEQLAEKVSNIKIESPSDDALLKNLEHYIHELGNTFAASNQNTIISQREFQENLTSIRSGVSTLDQRLMLLSEQLEAAAQNLREQPVKSEDSAQFEVLIARMDELQEKLIDAPARIGLASMEYQLHQLDEKIDQISGKGKDSAKVQLVHDEIQILKSAIEQATDMSGISRLEKELASIHQLLAERPVQSGPNTIQIQPANSRVMGDMITAIGRVEMGLAQLVQNNNMDALLRGFDQLNKQLSDQRSAAEKQGKALASQLNSALDKHATSQEKLIGSVLKQLGDVSKKADKFSTESQVAALNKNIQDLHAQIQAEIKSLSVHDVIDGVNSNVVQVFTKVENLNDSISKLENSLGQINSNVGNVDNSMDQINGLVATLNNNMNLLNKDVHMLSELPDSLDTLSTALQERFKALESQVNHDLPARMSDIVKHQMIEGSAQAIPAESFLEVRQELNVLRETIEKFAAHQMDLHQQALNQSKLQAEAIAQAQSIAQQESLAEARQLVIEARNAMQQQASQMQAAFDQKAAQLSYAQQAPVSEELKQQKNDSGQRYMAYDFEAADVIKQPMAEVAETQEVSDSVVFMDEVPVAAQPISKFEFDDSEFNDAVSSLAVGQGNSAIEQALSPMMSASADEMETEGKISIRKPSVDIATVIENMPQHMAPIELEDLSMMPKSANDSASKQDFIAAARRAAQAAANEAAEASLAVRSRGGMQKDPFLQETSEEDTGQKKSLLARLGIGGAAKAEKPAIVSTQPKLDAEKYVAPAIAKAMNSDDQDELLEPGENHAGSPLKKTLLMSASAAILAAGTFGVFTARSLDDQNALVDGDFWKSSDVTSSIPQEAQQPIEIPAASASSFEPLPALESEQDVKQIFEPATGSVDVVKPVSDQASYFAPYETVGGVPVPPVVSGKKVAAASAAKVETVQEKAAVLASLQFPMPIEAVGSSKLRTAAAQGNPSALLEVGNRYAEGKGVGRDVNEAIVWFTRAANLGSAAAQYRLGSFYEKGYGVNKDLKQAVSWYEKSAIAGNRKSMHNLAVLYAEGYQGKPNFELSMKWFREGAERGLADSQYNLGVIYARGLGVKQDLVEAYKWFAIAAEAGDSEALKKRDEIAAKMDPKMVHWAKSAVRLFQPKELDAIANDGQSPLETWDETPSAKISAVKELKRAA